MTKKHHVFSISSPESAQTAVQNAQPGDEMVIADGLYSDWEMAVSCKGTLENPITIRPETPNGVTLLDESAFKITGAYVTIQGFRFEDCRLLDSCILFDGPTGCRVTNCMFEGAFGRAAVITVKGRAVDTRIDHCQFIKPEARSVQVVVRGEQSPMRTRIDHNLFQDVPPIPAGNGRETIQIGQSQPKWGWFCPLTIVEHNTFLRCDGEIEIISNKSSRNIYRRNLFKDCKGELVMRGGSHCTIEENHFENCTGGIRLSGTHHRVTNNLIVNCRTGIKLNYGMTKELGGHYQAVGYCLLTNNTIVNARETGVYIGTGGGKDWKEKGITNIAPHNNRFAKNIIVGNQGTLVKIDASENTLVENLFHTTGSAIIPNLENNTIGDPQFVSETDFRLKPESPAHRDNIGASGNPIQTGPNA